MPKLQERTTQNTKQAYISLPKEHIDLLGWKKGAVLIVTSDKGADTLTLHRVNTEK